MNSKRGTLSQIRLLNKGSATTRRVLTYMFLGNVLEKEMLSAAKGIKKLL